MKYTIYHSIGRAWKNLRTFCFLLIATGLTVFTAEAQYSTVTLSGFNDDIIAEGTGTATALATTTNSISADNKVLMAPAFQPSYCTGSYTQYLPATFPSPYNSGLGFTLGSYSANNALRLAAANASGTLTFAPATLQASNIYLLATSGSGASTISVVVNFTDLTTQAPVTATIGDWYQATPATLFAVVQKVGRVTRDAASCPETNSGSPIGPNLYQVTIPISAANFFKTVASITITGVNTAAAGPIAAIVAASVQAPCAVPTASATALTAGSTTTSGINGSFTAASPVPTGGYLVVRYPHNATPTIPADGTTYTTNQVLGAGTVIASSTATSFTALGLDGSTTYDFYVYSYSTGTNCGGPVYFSASPLFGALSTAACSGLMTGTVPVGPGLPNTLAGGFSSLTNAMSYINTNGLAGNSILELQPGYDGTSVNETFPIAFPVNACVGTAKRLTIRPASSVSTPISITSNNTTATMNVNGGTYITIDGRPGGTGTTSALSIINTSATGVAIQFINDARNNTFTYCDIQGQNTSATSTALSGVIYFSTASSTLLNGNDSNTISYCDIHATTGGFPAIGVCSYGTTTTASWNDNNMITNCNIYDFFSATLATTAVKCDGGSHAFIISNNHIYQTTTRTYTTANQHRAFWLTPTVTGACGFVVTGNYIGGNNAAGTGTYTLAGAVATNYWGMDINHTGTTPTSIQGNTFTNISLTSTTTTANDLFRGIATGSTGNVNIGTVSGNVIGAATGTGTITLNGGSGSTSYGIRSSSTSIINIANNTIGGITTASTVSAVTAMNFIGIGVTSGTTTNIDNNLVGSLATANSINASNAATSTTQSVTGISATAGVTTTITNNTIANLNNNYATTGAGLTRGIVVTIASTSSTITGNTVRNLTSTSGTTGTGANSALVGIAMTSAAPSTVSANTVHSLVCAATSTTTAIQVEGIVFSSNGTTPTNLLTRNLVHSLDMTAINTSALLIGIDITGGANIVANNMVRMGFQPAGTDQTTAYILRGMFLNSTAANNIYHNSIYIGGAGVGTAVKNSMAFQRNAAGTHDVRNNIFVNMRANATTGGKHYQVYLNNATTLTLNNNIYYGGSLSTGNVFATLNAGSSDVNAYSAGWTATDANSLTGDPQFITPGGTSATVDLHINPTNPTPVESSGSLAATMTDDFDGQLRSSNTPVDIGADAGGFTPITMTIDSTVIDQNSAKVLTNTTNQLVVGIRVYAKNSFNALQVSSFALNTSPGTTDANDIANAKVFYTGSSSTFSTATQYGTTVAAPGSSAFNVTGSYTLAAGINYFWVTYDVKSTATPGNFIDTRVDNIVLTGGVSPGILNGDPSGSRKIAGPLSGNLTVGVGQQYTTITSAIADLTLLGVSAPITFVLTDALYNTASGEIFPITVNAFAGASPVNTATIIPNTGVTATISQSVANSLFRFDGVKYFGLDGRQLGSGTAKSLVVQNDNTAGSAITFINDAIGNTLQYAVFKSSSNVATTGVINFSTGVNLGNDSNTVKNCDIGDGATPPATLVLGLGSTDLLTKYNDYITISNCNLYNFWHASAESNAFKISAGNNSWTISGNSVYQTVSRAVPAGFYTFNLNGGGNTSLNSFAITNNYIGGSAPLCGGTPWTHTGSAGNLNTYFNMGNLSVSKFSNNTIANFALTTSSTSATGAGLLSVAQYINGMLNIDSNTIGSLTDTSSIVLTGGLASAFVPIYVPATNTPGTYSVSGNKFGGIKVNGGGTISNSITCITVTSTVTTITYNISNNMIGNSAANNIIAAASSSTTAQSVKGIMNTGSAVLNMTNNTIRNLTNIYSGSSTSGQVIGISSSNAVNTITGNTIDSLTSTAVHTGTGATASVIGIAFTSASGNSLVSQNAIYGLSNTAPSTAVQVTGIYFSGGTNDIVSRNLLHSFATSSTSATAQINGIQYAGATARLINNMVRLGIDLYGNPVTTAPVIAGILKTGGNMGAFFNSVYIGGTGVAVSPARTYAFMKTASNTDTVQNNIFVNERANASTGGSHAAVSLNNNTTLTMGYNLYKINTGDTLGFYNGTGLLTLNTWKSGSLVDATSIIGAPGFVNPTGAFGAIDLHLAGTTPAESYGIPVTSLTTDFDGNTRNATTPDLGADEGTFTPSDIAPPAISYTALTSTLSTADRTFTATITDATGTYLTGPYVPRVHFRKVPNGSSFISQAGTFVSGSATNSVWSFTIPSTLLGGVTGGDSVYYFVIAQDITPSSNIGSNPGGVEASDVSNVSTYPTANGYKIIPVISGPFSVGTGQTFTSLSNSGGMFDYLNTAVIGGDITISITSDIRELGTVSLNQLTETGVGNYKITIVPDAATERVLYSNVTTGMIKLNGADRIKFDGRFAGSGRYLRFIDTCGNGVAVISFQNDAHRDTLMYCTVQGNNSSTGDILFGLCTAGTGNDSNAVIYCMLKSISPTVLTNTNISCSGTAGFENSENTIAYNEILGSKYGGINLNAVGTGDNWYIYNNYFYQDMTQLPSAGVDHWIIYIQGGGNHIIRKNSIGGAATDRSGATYTINSTGSSIYCIYNKSTSTNPITVDSNTIGNITLTGASTTYGIHGVYNASGVMNVSNNTIGNLTNPADSIFTNFNVYGVTVAGGTATVNNNTIANLYNRSSSTTARAAGIYITGGTATIASNTVHDIFLNTASGTAFTSGYVSSGIYFLATTASTIEKNTIYTIDAGTGLAATGIWVGSSGTATVRRNRIYDVFVNNAGITGLATGMYFGGTGSMNVTNNQVTVGRNSSNPVIGIEDVRTSGTVNYLYNSVVLSGTTASGTSNSYAILRTSSTSTVISWNNIFYNKRTTGGSGFNYATGSVSATGIAPITSNYNLLVVNDTARISEFPTGAGYGVSAYNTQLYTGNLTYNTNWMESTANLPVQNLFIDTAVGNLGTLTTDPSCWYANGKGIAIPAQDIDFNNATSVRSVTRAAGTTDIGSVEFNTATLPPSALASAAPANNTTTTYTFANRNIAAITWGAPGSVPSAMDVKFYSGAQAPNLLPSKTQFAYYTNITPTGGSAYTYDVALLYDSAYHGNVSNAASTRIARYDTQWRLITTSSANTITGMMGSNSASSLAAFGNFTGTDIANTLPVQLLSFTAAARNGDVLLAWSTASETNNTGFDIERSADGKTFIAAKFVKGAGSSNSLHNYNEADEKAFRTSGSNVLYYRLKQLDRNGEFTYSNTVMVVNKTAKETSVSAYPNPFSRNFDLVISSVAEAKAVISVYDLSGKQVATWNEALAAGENAVSINVLSEMELGVYFIRVTTGSESQVLKMVKTGK